MDEIEKNTKRLNNMESALMHLQNDFDSLNEVVLSTSRKMDKLASLIKKLTDRFEASEQTESPRNAEDEKPPHY